MQPEFVSPPCGRPFFLSWPAASFFACPDLEPVVPISFFFCYFASVNIYVTVFFLALQLRIQTVGTCSPVTGQQQPCTGEKHIAAASAAGRNITFPRGRETGESERSGALGEPRKTKASTRRKTRNAPLESECSSGQGWRRKKSTRFFNRCS